MCRMPKGISDFELLRKDNYVYVDKTKYIELLEHGSARYIHFLRPRRFGKTLFTSMLSAYYDINARSDFDELFQNTYIYEHQTKERNQYYILRFDFSGLNTNSVEELKTEFYERVKSICLKFIEQYQIEIVLNETTSASSYLSNFLDAVSTRLDHSIYVIVDEYDHFANELLSFEFNEFSNAVSKNGYVRKFYEVLKTGTVDSTIGRIFVTGVSPITLDSMTSGYNISTNLSLDERFNEMMGFTSNEMKYLISMTDHIENEAKTLLEMKQIYDGYMFSKRGTHHIYNSNMALYYLDFIQSNHRKPDDIVDPNIYSGYKKIENLLKIKPDPEQLEALMAIISEETILCKLTTSYDPIKQFTKDDFVSLLYYLGYLTISGSRGSRVILSVPNDVIRRVYFDYFNEILKQKYEINTNEYEDAVDNILYDKDNTLFVKQIEEILHSLDNRDYMKFRENSTKIAAMAIIKTNASVLVKSEYPVPEGYIDLVLFPYQTEGATALIELKYIKKENYSKQAIQELREQALNQLERYHQAKEFQNIDVVKWILIFCKDQCVLNEKIN